MEPVRYPSTEADPIPGQLTVWSELGDAAATGSDDRGKSRVAYSNPRAVSRGAASENRILTGTLLGGD